MADGMPVNIKASSPADADTRDGDRGLLSVVAVYPLGTGKHQLSESVAMHLREQIISGKLQAGQFLRIDAIARALRVSTTPVREGLLLLQSESYVRLLPRRGFVVNSFDRDDLRDLFWAQAMIGAELAARAAGRMSEADIDRLQELHTAHKTAVAAGDESAAARAGHQFHRAINLAAGSPRLALLLGSLTRQLSNRFYASIEGALQNSVTDHRKILEALRLGAEDAARSLMHRHILSGGDHLVEVLARPGTAKAGTVSGRRGSPRPKRGKRAGRRARAGASR